MSDIDKFLNSLYEEYKRLHKESESIKNLILLRGGKIPVLSSKEESSQSTDYPVNSKLESKIKYVLEKLGPSCVPQIVAYIIDNEPELTESKVKSSVTQYCSNMFSSGILKAEKEGRSNRYSIKKE